MKKLTHIAIALAVVPAVHAATIEQVIVRQQWPWSTDIKVEYKLSGVTAEKPVDLTLAAYNGDVPLTLPAAAISGDRFGIAESGVGELTIDPVAAFGTGRVAIADFKVKLTATESAENINEAVYKIFCLTNGTCENVTRKDLLNGKWGSIETDFSKIGNGFTTSLDDVLIWTAVTNDVKYKTTHLVMRKISAAGKTWQIGSPTSETSQFSSTPQTSKEQPQRNAQLNDDYYIGVFEITQAQYKKYASYIRTPNHVGDLLPMESDHYQGIRGAGTQLLDPYGEVVNWPTNSHLHTVASNSDLAYLRGKFGGVEFDLPTEAQWEFACRAGTTTALNSGKGLDVVWTCWRAMTPEFEELGWCATNALSQTQIVGQKKPNAFGLYDMHGNVAEYCLDWHDTYPDTPDPLVDPKGPSVDGTRVARGGSCSDPAAWCRSAYRESRVYYTSYKTTGFRLVCPVGTTWE